VPRPPDGPPSNSNTSARASDTPASLPGPSDDSASSARYRPRRPERSRQSTAAPILLRDALRVTEFVNADAIAGGLSAFRPDSVAIPAGRAMLERMRRLAAAREDFAFETTLAGRSFVPWLTNLKASGYHVHVLFLSLESADLAVNRVAARVRLGGHDVPEDTVRRRYARGLRNFVRLYMPLATSWQLFDNSRAQRPRPVASGRGERVQQIVTRRFGRRSRRPIVSDDENADSPDELVQDSKLVGEALARAVRDALRQHKLAGNPVPEWHDGQVRWLTPEEIPDLAMTSGDA